MEWAKVKDLHRNHTASTMYLADGYKVWKGKYRVISIIYSADEWHLERTADHQIIWSARTAKECKEEAERRNI